MASSSVEFGSCVLNRRSTPRITTRYEKNNKGFLHSCIASTNSAIICADFESENWKTQNNVDLSWLPNFDDDNSASESHHHNGEIEFDYSWLPDHIEINGNGSTAAWTSSREVENDSWLPSTAIVNSEHDDSWLPNYNDVKKNNSTTPSKPINLNRCWKTEGVSNYSRFSSNHTVTNGNQSKDKKSKNQDDWERSHEVIFSGDQQIQPLNKKPESSRSQGQASSSKSNCSVETDSLGGVSTLLRRFQDLAETRNNNRKANSSSGCNHGKSPLIVTEGNSNNPSKVFDASERCAPPSTTAEKVDDVEKDKFRVVDIINKLSREEELAASPAAGNPNELFARTSNTSDPLQFAGENRCFSHVTGKPRFIRGRQAFNKFLNLMEQDKQHELESLARRKPVSQFSHRGRIRALLRFRFIRPDPEPKTLKPESINTSSHSIQELNDADQLENYHNDWISEYSQSQSDWDEEEEDFHDWISEIARPRSHWECMRQARYHEMLHLYTHEGDLRELLERRCVAGFLSSGLRDSIDQLMAGFLSSYRRRREYNEFINQTTTLEERSNVNYDSYQSSSSIVSSCKQVLKSY